jgi:hypothetical protein
MVRLAKKHTNKDGIGVCNGTYFVDLERLRGGYNLAAS